MNFYDALRLIADRVTFATEADFLAVIAAINEKEESENPPAVAENVTEETPTA